MSTLAALASVSGAVAGGLVDARTGYIPDRITRASAVLASVCAACDGSAVTALTGSLATAATLFALYAFTCGRGLGFGDVKLGIAIGAGFGPSAGLMVLATSFVFGGAYAAWLLVTRRARRGETIAFGPFLAAGTLTVFVLLTTSAVAPALAP